VPTLVIHGDADPLVHHSGGVATAEAVPGAELLTIEGMGHDLPVEKWDEIVDAVAAHTAKATATPARQPQAS
jgi:pimeloyl-ACP methyl ester carboxylesterase